MNTCIRYLYTVVNLLFIVAGLILVSFAVYVLVASPIHELLVNISGNMTLIYGMIIMGGIIFLVGACGAFGACYENRCLLIIYLCCNILFLLAQIGIVAFAVIEKDNFKEHLSSVWRELNNDTKFLIQERFNCCGFNDTQEWGDFVPVSCLNATNTESNSTWTISCYNSIASSVDENVVYIAVIAGLIILLQCFQTIVTCFLVREYGRKSSIKEDRFGRGSHNNVDTVRGYDMDFEDASFDPYKRPENGRGGYGETNMNYSSNQSMTVTELY